MKEGEAEEKQATLVTTGIFNKEYSFYLPDGEWQKAEADTWRSVANEDVQLWAGLFEKDFFDRDRVEGLYTSDGYEWENGELVKLDENIIRKVRMLEDNGDVWCVGYSYPMEAEEGWGRELPVIADTFAITASEKIMDGYISAYENGIVTIDRQLWLTPESEDWKPEYNEAGGFEVVDAEGEDITYPLHEECTFYVLENHYYPTIELSKEEFADYLTEMEYPVLWIFTVEEGQVMSITEQYVP